MKKVDSFLPEVLENLKYYVYRLIDPRNGETFYVGKGKDQRLFAHIKEELNQSDIENSKLKRIREIKLSGFDVAHVIHRHGLDEKTAFEVEAALIDAYPGLSNIMGGMGNSDRGVMHANELIRKYCAEIAVLKHKVIMININRSALDNSNYDATRYAWKLSVIRANRADFVLSIFKGIIKDVFIADKWMEASPGNFPSFPETDPGRYGFYGKDAPNEIKELYVGKRLDKKFTRPGASNPIKYNY